MSKIGIISNPRSYRNRRGLEGIRRIIAGRGDLLHHEIEEMAGLPEIFAEFASAGVVHDAYLGPGHEILCNRGLRGVGGEHNTIGGRHRPRLLHGNPFDVHTGGLILTSGLVDIRGVDIEIETERAQQLATTRRA